MGTTTLHVVPDGSPAPAPPPRPQRYTADKELVGLAQRLLALAVDHDCPRILPLDGVFVLSDLRTAITRLEVIAYHHRRAVS
jgi:hypothetical protein